MGGHYVPSLLAAIGGVIEKHMIRTGFLSPPRQPAQDAEAPPRALTAGERPAGSVHDASRRGLCPRCGAQSLRRQEGCLVCDNCGYSKCS
jgi:ribonucleoside-diphosphate reductase alpha chain